MRKVVYILLTLSILLNAWLIFRNNEPVIKEVTVHTVDTIVTAEYHTDTIYSDKILYRPQFVYDTVHIRDKVYVEDTSQVYRDSTDVYDLSVNAVKMNWYNLNIHKKDTVRITNTVERVVIKNRQSRIGVGIYAGYGYDIGRNTLSPQIGIGVTYNLFRK